MSEGIYNCPGLYQLDRAAAPPLEMRYTYKESVNGLSKLFFNLGGQKHNTRRWNKLSANNAVRGNVNPLQGIRRSRICLTIKLPNRATELDIYNNTGTVHLSKQYIHRKLKRRFGDIDCLKQINYGLGNQAAF